VLAGYSPAKRVEASLGGSYALRDSLRERGDVQVTRRFAAALAVTALTLAAGALGACGSSSDTDAASSSTAAGAVPEQLRSGLRVGMDISYPPMEYFEEGQKPTGIDVDVATAIAKELGVPLKIQNIGFDSLISSLQAGRVDMLISGLQDTPERQQRLNLIDYFKTGYAFLVNDGNPKGITSLETLCGHTAGQVSGTVTLTAVQEASKKCSGSTIKVLSFGSSADVNLAIKAGRADANLDDTPALSYVAKTSGGGSDYDVVPQPDAGANRYSGIATLKSDAAVTQAIVGAYKKLLADGTIKAIYTKHGFPSSVPSQFLQNSGTD
jgi:polar amino acid transport system substrate-binding protein